MGITERTVDNLIQAKKKDSFMAKHVDFSSNDSEEDTDRLTKTPKEANKQFNEAELFRKKKPKQAKEENKPTALKATKSMTTIEATPMRRKLDGSKKTPRSEKTKGRDDVS